MNLLTVDEVTALWRCHRVTVLRLLKRGEIHAIQFGDEILFYEDEIMQLANPRIAVYPHLTLRRRTS